MNGYSGTGIIKYDPYRRKMQNNVQHIKNKHGKMKNRVHWWCVANVSKELSRYYRFLLIKQFGLETLTGEKDCHNLLWCPRYKAIVEAPAWDCHISIIRGERPNDKLKSLWKKYDNETIHFTYDGFVKFHNKGQFFSIDIESNSLLHLRNELLLPTNYGFHITIGKINKKLDDISIHQLNKDRT